MKTQNSIYKNLKKPFAGVIILLLSVMMMAPSCREQRYYEDEVYPDGNYVDDGAVYSSAPDWAPAYSNHAVVRYYYFPDYYMYYDVWSANYVYWDGFGWVYATTYPGYIGYFNPYGAYVVVLGHNVYRPWGNHYYYVEQYPQYYYQNNYYGHRDNSIVRGYDENGGGAVYVPRDSRQGKDMLNSPANRKEINNLKQPPREGKGSPADQKGMPSNRQQQNTIDKNDRQAPFDKGQDRQQPGPVKRDQPGDNRNAPDMKNNLQPQKGFDQQQPQKNMERQPQNNMERQQQKYMERQQQRNFNDQRNFDRPQQRQVPPANLQRPQQQGGQPPMQRSSPPAGGGMDKRGGGGGRR